MPKKSGTPLKLCKNNAPTCAGLTHTSDSNSTLDRCQQSRQELLWTTVHQQRVLIGETQKICVLL
jgi:hypothetical protein